VDEETIKKLREAGKIAAAALQHGKSLIKVDATVLDVTNAVEEKISSMNGGFAFPPQISINSIAAHYAALHDDTVVFKAGDVVKLDLGVHIDGYIADTALTVDLGDNKELIDASRNALNNALKIVKPGVTLNEIGTTIQEAIVSKGFNPVRNLSGHGLAQYTVHDKPSIPNIPVDDDTVLEEGMSVAIEPFATTGAGVVGESGNASIFSIVQLKPVRNNFTREVIKLTQQFHGMPFSQRQLVLQSSAGKVAFGLRELKQLECLHEHPPLKEKTGGLVSQAEHSIIVQDKPIVYTKHDD